MAIDMNAKIYAAATVRYEGTGEDRTAVITFYENTELGLDLYNVEVNSTRTNHGIGPTSEPRSESASGLLEQIINDIEVLEDKWTLRAEPEDE